MSDSPVPKRRKLGAAIPLEKFATAKKSGFDKRKVLERERKLNAKKVNKFRKIMKRMSESGETRALRPWERGEDAATGSPAEASPSGDGASRDAGGGPGRMRRDAMNDGRSAARSGRKLEGPGTSGRDEGKGQGAAGEREGTRGGAGAGASGKKRRFNALEAEAKRVAAEQADRAADNAKAKEEAERERKVKARRKSKKLFHKVTRTGQPLLKSRMEVLLGKIQGGTA